LCKGFCTIEQPEIRCAIEEPICRAVELAMLRKPE
jgi:hypothetical protein